MVAVFGQSVTGTGRAVKPNIAGMSIVIINSICFSDIPGN